VQRWDVNRLTKTRPNYSDTKGLRNSHRAIYRITERF
jgi:hypothetical protein